MSVRHSQVGLSQRVRLEWLERTASLVLSGIPPEQIRKEIDVLLCEKVSVGGGHKGSNRSKVIGNLMSIWVTVREEIQPLRDDGLKHLSSLPTDSHIVVHWGMTMAAYPFWAVVAETVGRLIRLQGTMSVAQVQRRLREKYGERQTVARSAQRIIRSFVDWGVLADTERKGIYKASATKTVDAPKVAAWLIEAFLHSIPSGKAQIRELIQNPSLFPFSLPLLRAEQVAALTRRIENVSHSLNQDMVVLR